MADRWNFEKVGLSYRCWSETIQTEFRLTHMKRSRGDLSGELAVLTNFEGVKTHNGVLHVARFNVLSSSTRAALARTLEKRTPGFDMDWFDGLEWLCQNVILSEAAGEPISEVGLDTPTPLHDQFMVEPFILKDRPAILFGPGGVGKSLLALACAMSVASGREIIPGVAPAVHGPVLYLDWETTKHVINDRIQAIARGHGFTPDGMYYRRCIRPLADDAEELSTLVASKGIVMIVVDSAAYAMGAQGEYGDANESVLRMHEAIRLIGVSSQIVDHVNKMDARSRGGTASPYGSAYKTNAARISWEVRKAPSSTGLAINLYHAKSNDTALLEPIGLSLDWEPDKIIFRSSEVLIDQPQAEPGDTESAILETLEVYGPMTSGAICDALPHLNANTVRSTLKRMVGRGQLLLIDGTYRLARPTAVKLRSLPGSSNLDA